MNNNIGVAVLDTGIYKHIDFGNRIIAFKDFINNRVFPYDDSGHGTHVSGIIAGDGYASHGRFKGIAPMSQIISVKVLDSNGNGNIENVIKGTKWIINNKDIYNIKIVNISFGTTHNPSNTSELIKNVENMWNEGIIVVALGRNAFGETFPEQQANVKKAAKAIADLVEAKYQIVITHSNGPQVGMIQTAMTEFARLEPEDRTVAPMSVCGAMSEGYIGYDLQNAIREELLNRGIYKTVSTIITQVRVDPFDIAFSEPSKIIGRYMTKEEAEAEEEKGNYVVEEEPGRFRRIIAAPMPIDIYEIDAVKALLSADQIVIAAGGGGIPVLQQGSHLKGASAIIEKDYTAAKLAELVGADTLLFLTAYDKLTIGKGTADEKVFDNVSAADLHQYIKAGHFPAKTTFPKVDASIRFVAADSDRKAVIANLEQAKEGLDGKAGTTITA